MAEKTSVPEMYGSLVFNDKVMKDRLPKDIYRAVHKTIQNGTHLELDVANTVARNGQWSRAQRILRTGSSR